MKSTQKMKLIIVISLCLCLVKLCCGFLPGLGIISCIHGHLHGRHCLQRPPWHQIRITRHPGRPEVPPVTRKPKPEDSVALGPGHSVPSEVAPVTEKPMPKDSMTLGPGGKSFATQLFLKGLASYGWMNNEVERLEISSNYEAGTHNMSIKAFSPSITINGTYTGTGRILNKPVNRGTILIILENFQWQWDACLELAQTNGTQHWTRIASTAIVNEPKKTNIYLYCEQDGGIGGLKVAYESLFSELQKDFDHIMDKLLLKMYDVV